MNRKDKIKMTKTTKVTKKTKILSKKKIKKVNYVLKSLLQGFNHKQKASAKLQQRYQMNYIREG